MRLSVIIPVHNEERYLKSCLEALINQIDKPDEIIVVDNNCTDDTIKIAKKYPVKIIKEKRQGMIFARNSGFNSAQYEIIARVDADTIVFPNWTQQIKKNIKNGVQALTGPVIFYDLPFFKTSIFPCQIYFNFLRLIQLGKNTLVGPNMILTKKAWQKVKKQVCLDDKKVHEDIDLAIHLLKNNIKITVDEKLVVKASSRRIKYQPISFFIEYPWRFFKTFFYHLF